MSIAILTGLLGVSVPATTASAEQPESCPAARALISEDQFDNLSNDTNCSLSGRTVQLDSGVLVTVPPLDTTIGAMAASPDGSTQDRDVIAYQDEDGNTAIRTESETIGNSDAIPTTATPQAAAVSTGRCDVSNRTDYNLEGPHWIETFRWWYNDASSAGSGSLDRIKAGAQAWVTPATKCDTVYDTRVSVAYQAGGSDANYPVKVNSNGTCPSSGSGHSTVGWGALNAGNAIAYTCWWATTSTGIMREAHVKFKSNGPTWWRNESGSGCSSEYDLQYTAVHEFGHALGLDHSSSSGNQSMQATQPPCFTGARNLGTGDMFGMNYANR